ncbi:hypothetical protein RRG08_017374, partial [Elysia crispata]
IQELAAAQDDCPEGWFNYQSSCYTLVHGHEYFQDAQTKCYEIDGLPVEISSKEENDFVKDLVRKEAFNNETGAYIGALQMGGVPWFWVHSDDDVSFSDWVKPVPQQSIHDTSCASLNKADDWSWVVQDCGPIQGMASVCERCPQQKKCNNGKCYEILCNLEFYDNIQDRCEAVGGKVVVIDSQEEHDFIKDFLNSASVPKSEVYNTSNIWLSVIGGDFASEFTLSDGTPLTYTNWAVGEPSNYISEECVVLDATEDWKWNDVPCHIENAILCESRE